MRLTISKLDKLLIAVVIIIAISTACGSKLTPPAIPSLTPIPTMITLSTPTSTEVPPTITPLPPTITPLTPTITPITVPLLQPDDYLLTVEELPVELLKSYTIVYLQPDGSMTYSITYFYAGVGRMSTSITVAAQPYLKVPDDALFGNDTIKDPLLGENSAAYINNGNLTYIFYKGNTLVSLSGYLSDQEIVKRGELTLEDMVNLGQIVDARLLDELPLTPLTFPEQLDQAEYDQYLKSLALAKQVSGSYDLVQAETFLPSDSICLSMEFIERPQSYMFAIFDVQNNIYIQKYIPENSSPCTYLTGPHSGQFELHLAINDKLVAILPFVIQ